MYTKMNMNKEPKDPVSTSYNRLKSISIFGALMVLIILGQYARLMLLDQPEELQEAIPFPAIERGPILDRNGELLAITTRLDSVTLSGPNITDVEETASLLAQVLDMDQENLAQRLDTTAAFSYIKRKISPTESRKIRELKGKGYLKGIYLEEEFGRNYPRQSLGSHVLGYVGTDNIGLDGIEYTLNDILSPPVMGGEEDTIHGNQVYLTLDMNIQYFADKTAKRLMEENTADSVMILVMAAKSGDILAYSSQPNFDPNTYGQYPQDTWRNRPLTLTYEPGSVFKVFSMASFLENNALSLDDQFYCDGDYDLENPFGEEEHINCLGVHGWVDVGDILKYSCNTGAGKASEVIDSKDFYNTLIRFGFNTKTELPLLGETKGLLRAPDQWSYRSKPTLAMGQEIGVSAMQVITAATALANGGLLLRPHIVKKIVDPAGNVLQEYKRAPVREVLKPQVAQTILSLMEGGSESGGTGRRAKIDNFRIAIKTGTAQMADPTTGKYSEDQYIASALSLFPLPDPQLIAYVVIKNPKGDSYFGGRLAAPAIKDLSDFLITYLDLPMEGEPTYAHSGKISIKANRDILLEGKMPNLTGYSKREVLTLFENPQLQITIKGSGWVQAQYPPPGTPWDEIGEVILELQ